MQGAKAIYGMLMSPHSVWCKCQRGGSMLSYPGAPVTSYEELCAACDEIGCEMMTFDEMCSWAHYSPLHTVRLLVLRLLPD